MDITAKFNTYMTNSEGEDIRDRLRNPQGAMERADLTVEYTGPGMILKSYLIIEDAGHKFLDGVKFTAGQNGQQDTPKVCRIGIVELEDFPSQAYFGLLDVGIEWGGTNDKPEIRIDTEMPAGSTIVKSVNIAGILKKLQNPNTGLRSNLNPARQGNVVNGGNVVT